MSKSRRVSLLFTLAGATCLATVTQAQQGDGARKPLGIGRTALPEEVRAWDIDVRPDGLGLPPGKGSVKDGEILFQERCAPCHGDFGEGTGRFPVLAGGRGTLAQEGPVKTVGSFWPYASTLYDYIRRAKPYGAARSLTDTEVFAAAAYVLHLNDIVGPDFVFSRESLPQIRMPNAGSFRDDDRETAEKQFWQSAPCMKNCASEPARIIGRASAPDLTPDAKNRPRGD